MAKKKKQTKTKEPKPRQYFTFYESFFQAIDNLPEEMQLSIYKAITEYALYKREPSFDGFCLTVWALLKPVLDSSWTKFEAGTKGGAPKGNKNAKRINQTGESTPEIQPSLQQSIEQREDVFYNSIMLYNDEGWDADLLESFYNYWSESNRDKSQMRFEAEQYWDLHTRLCKWAQKEDIFNP